MSVGDGEKFIKNWYEVSINNIEFNADSSDEYLNKNLTWNVIDKGGAFRRWYGNKVNIVKWKDDGSEVKSHPKAAVRSPQYFFKPHISWTLISSSKFSARYFEKGYTLDTASNCIYFKGDKVEYYVLGLLNTKLVQKILDIMNPTLNYSCGVIGLIPYKRDKNVEHVIKIVEDNIKISKLDWDSFENSWEFKIHPLLNFINSNKINDSFEMWNEVTAERFNKLKSNEQEINKIFIDVYNLKDEITPEIEDKEITIRLAE